MSYTPPLAFTLRPASGRFQHREGAISGGSHVGESSKESLGAMEGHRKEDREFPEPRHSDPVLPSDRAHFRPHREGLQRPPASPLVGGGVLLAGANHAPPGGAAGRAEVVMRVPLP